jgi:ABC-type lipoprotein release transport system permease subunit
MPKKTMNFLKNISVFLTVLTVHSSAFIPIVLAKPSLNSTSQFIAETSENQLTEQRVREFLKNIDKEVFEKNIDAVVKNLAPFIQSKITVEKGSRSVTIELNGIEETRNYLEESIKNIKSTEELDKSLKIEIYPNDNFAIVSRIRTADVTLNDGKRMIISSQGKARVALIDRELKIIAWEQISQVDRRPLITP